MYQFVTIDRYYINVVARVAIASIDTTIAIAVINVVASIHVIHT